MKKLILSLFLVSVAPSILAQVYVKINPLTPLRTLMKKYDCSLKVVKDIYIQKGEDEIFIGKIRTELKKVDYVNKRVLKVGRVIKLNHIDETGSYLGDEIIMTNDKTIHSFYDRDFWENTMPEMNVYDIYKRSQFKLEVQCTHQQLIEA